MICVMVVAVARPRERHFACSGDSAKAAFDEVYARLPLGDDFFVTLWLGSVDGGYRPYEAWDSAIPHRFSKLYHAAA